MNWNLASVVQEVSTAILAQATSAPAAAPGKAMAVDWIRIAIFGLTLVVSFLMMFYVIYPVLLKRAIRTMPLSMFGGCLAFWLLAMGGLVLGLFWKHFVWGDPLVDLNWYWPKVAWGCLTGVSFFSALGFYRSPRMPKIEAVGKTPVALKTAKT